MIFEFQVVNSYCLFANSSNIKVLPDEDSECEPPDPIPNSEVKPLSADGSVGLPHVRVGHRQASNYKTPSGISWWGFLISSTRQ